MSIDSRATRTLPSRRVARAGTETHRPAPRVRKKQPQRYEEENGAAEEVPNAVEKGTGARGERVDAANYIEALRGAGVRGGLAEFPLPGSKPLRQGIVVPEDYELPEGFARHYQVTDDGAGLDPILIVAPGYEIVDENGDVVELVDDWVVPPEHAPSDLPLELLVRPGDEEQP